MAVSGLGGIGKTQTVLHFAYSVLKEHTDVSVFWVPVLSFETFEQAYEEIAALLGISRTSGGEEDSKKLVQRRLSSPQAGKWLMIVDNADDMEMMEGVLQYLPKTELGSTIFTTRYSGVAHRLAGNDVVELERLTHLEAVAVMEKTLKRKDVLSNEPGTVEKLLIKLEFLPLALSQAIVCDYRMGTPTEGQIRSA